MTTPPERFPALLRRLDAISRNAMARLVREAPVPPGTGEDRTTDALTRALRVAPRHTWLFRHWLTVLARENTPDDAHGDPHGDALVSELDHCYAALGFPPEMARYHRAALARLPELLRDEVSAQELLFDGTDVVPALAAYQRNVFTAHLNEVCAGLVRTAAAGRPGPLRVVELGGGAATTTEAVLAALGDTPAEYVFTDVSRLFTTAARDRLGVRTALLDIDADFAGQGFPAGSADVVLAGNVLHNATDVPRALARIRELLAPGGEFVFTESTHATDAVLTSMLFLLSPPPGAAPLRGGRVFLRAEEWREELEGAGFTVRRVLPASGSPWAASGQLLWHAAAPAPVPATLAAAPHGTGARDVLDWAQARRGEGPVCEVDGVPRTSAQLRLAARSDPSSAEARFVTVLEAAPSGSAEPDGVADREDPAGRLAVVAGDPAGARAALRAWESGAFVLCAGPDTAPARLLSWLERTRAEEAVLPAALARALPQEPSAPLTDLSALRRVVAVGASAETVAAWAALGPGIVAPGAAAVPDGELAARTARAADAALDGLDLDGALEAQRRVGRASLLSLLDALRRAGCFVRPDDRHTPEEAVRATGAAPEHRRLVRRWLDVLLDEGLLRRDDDGERLCTGDVPDAGTGTELSASWDEAARCWHKALGGTGTVDYARSCADALPELLTGERQPFTLLFPEGSAELARALYQESVTARYQQHAVAAFVAALAEGRSLRVLEVGGGTGTTTEVVLSELKARGADVDYLFTDVSAFFLGRARERFGTQLRYGVLDIDSDPLAQGRRNGEFDVIVGGGVLNAAADTDASVRGLSALLAPGGRLVLTEPTGEEHWVLASQAFMMAAPRDARAATGASFLSLAQWRDVLDGAGLRRDVELPGPGHPLEPLGHRVFAAARADTPESVTGPDPSNATN